MEGTVGQTVSHKLFLVKCVTFLALVANGFSANKSLSFACWYQTQCTASAGPSSSCLAEVGEGQLGRGELAGEDLGGDDGVRGVGVVHAVPADELGAVLAHPEARAEAAHVRVVVVGRPAVAAARHERLLES